MSERKKKRLHAVNHPQDTTEILLQIVLSFSARYSDICHEKRLVNLCKKSVQLVPTKIASLDQSNNDIYPNCHERTVASGPITALYHGDDPPAPRQSLGSYTLYGETSVTAIC